MITPYGVTHFCDDIREEIGGKIILIGVYGTELILFDPLPAQLPKLCLFVTARFPIEKPIRNLKLQIYFPEDSDDKPQVSVEIPVEATPENWKPPELPFADAMPSFNLANSYLLSPFVIKQEGYLRVRLIANNEERVRVGALKITSKPIPMAAASSPTA